MDSEVSKSGVRVELADKTIWKKFYPNTEMITKKVGGRIIFPHLEYKIKGLQADCRYKIYLFVERADNENWAGKEVKTEVPGAIPMNSLFDNTHPTPVEPAPSRNSTYSASNSSTPASVTPPAGEPTWEAPSPVLFNQKNPFSYSVTFQNYGQFALWSMENSTANSIFDKLWYASLYKNDENGIDIQICRNYQSNPRVEFMYQVIFKHSFNIRKKKIIRGIINSNCQSDRYTVTLKIPKFFFTGFCALGYNLWDFQAVSYTIIDTCSIRRVNFEENLFGKSESVLAEENELYVPIEVIISESVNSIIHGFQFVSEHAPKLARKIRKDQISYRLQTNLELLLQIMHGVQIPLEEKNVKALLKLSDKYKVLNVKRYCEKQLIWRYNFEFSETRKFKIACKYNLNILMNQVLRNVKTAKKLAKLASIAIEMESMDTNISKILIAKMYQIS
ncbi:hypothetical protein CAEBREN_03636 [Caenorhabditis brenneri]|uniref:T-box domain-containing protein n=1 Tax=Caenorhabditis brenneri TaxID=135651 RepID=G0MMC3_CAEBE|nr:hypothetical protein CAEBREN_03636 [Caenorhabditis brenneri]